MATGIFAQGTLLKIGDGGGPEVFTTITNVRDLTGPGLSSATWDATTHSSPNKWAEIGIGMKTPGEISFTIQYVPTDPTHNAATGLLRDFNNRILRNFREVFPDVGATFWQFAAYVTGFEPGAPVDDALTVDVTLTLSGAPTLA